VATQFDRRRYQLEDFVALVRAVTALGHCDYPARTARAHMPQPQANWQGDLSGRQHSQPTLAQRVGNIAQQRAQQTAEPLCWRA